jgi:hypothetical protein
MLRSLLKEYSYVCANRDERAPSAIPQRHAKLILAKALSHACSLPDSCDSNPLAISEDNLDSTRA